MVGLNFEYPIFNRDARAQHRRALLRRDQAEKALDNLKQLVELDVRNAYIEVNRTKEQISASTATRKFQEEKLRIETEKFRVGRAVLCASLPAACYLKFISLIIGFFLKNTSKSFK